MKLDTTGESSNLPLHALLQPPSQLFGIPLVDYQCIPEYNPLPLLLVGKMQGALTNYIIRLPDCKLLDNGAGFE
jgi:hypothetical protein